MPFGFFLSPSVAEPVNQRRRREPIPWFFLHGGLQCGSRFFKSFLLQQHQPETKIKLVPRGLKLDRLSHLFGRFVKSACVIQCKSYLLNCNNRKWIERLGLEVNHNRLIATPRIAQENSALPVHVRITWREFDCPPRLRICRLPIPVVEQP